MDALFVYLVRFPELVSAVVNATGPLFYPRLYTNGSTIGPIGVPRDGRSLAAAGVIVGAAIVYAATAAKPVAHGLWQLLPAVILHALLVFPVNYRTYALLRERRERDLVSGLLTANILGILVVGVGMIFLSRVPPAVLWIIPIQQMAFLWLTHHVSYSL